VFFGVKHAYIRRASSRVSSFSRESGNAVF